MERDTNPFWEHPMVPGARGRTEPGGGDPDPEPASESDRDSPAHDFGVAVSIPKFTAVRREPWRDDEDEGDQPRPVKPVEPYQHQWSGGWRDFLDAQAESEPDEYRDEFDEMLLPQSESRRWQWRMSRRTIAVACWAGLACLLVGFILLAFVYASPTSKTRGAPKAEARHPAPTTVAASAVPSSGAPPSAAASSVPSPLLPGPNATPGCVDSTAGDTVTGTGVGGTDSGPKAILWFEHSYYVERSAVRARQAVAQYARVSSVDKLQRGIDSVPLGTTYCARIEPSSPQSSSTEPAGARQWQVEITEQRPGEDGYVIDQTISTISSDDGTVLITDIVAVE